MSNLPTQQAQALDALRQAFLHHQDHRILASLIEVIKARDQFSATLQEELNRMVLAEHQARHHALSALQSLPARAMKLLLGPQELTAAELQANIDHIDTRLRRERHKSTSFALSRERAQLQRLLDARQARHILLGHP